MKIGVDSNSHSVRLISVTIGVDLIYDNHKVWSVVKH